MNPRWLLLLFFVVACTEAPREEAVARWQEPVKVGDQEIRQWVIVRADPERAVLTQTRTDALGVTRLQQPINLPPAPSGREIQGALRRVQRLASLPPEVTLAGGFLWTGHPCPPSHRCLEVFRMDARTAGPVERWLVDLTADQLLEEAQ